MAEDDQGLPEGARLLDRYTVLDCVAGGGMATIHRAIDERFGRIVCVKLLRLDLDGPSSTNGKSSGRTVYEHFLREAQALSKLQHPNTLRIYDFGYIEDGQRPFQVSEFLDGGTLRNLVRAHGSLGPPATLAILERVTGAIAEAHEQNILHRDIKPSNILFARVGGLMMPKLADFGISRSLRARSGRGGDAGDAGSPQGVGLFSPRWAAPEQLAGSAEGPATDVYALALLTIYMLAGVSAFDTGDLLDIYDPRARSDEVLRKRLFDLRVGHELVPTLLRAVASDPTQRTTTAVGFLDEMRVAFGDIRAALPQALAEPHELARSVPAAASPPPSAFARPSPPAAQLPRTVRVVIVHEKLDLEMVGERGVEIRFRVSILPAREQAFQIQIKGLNCFVSRFDAAGSARPTPALSATQDGAVDFVSTGRAGLARIWFAFGRPTAEGTGHSFHLAGTDVVVPGSERGCLVALDLGPEREIVVLFKRS